jgi:hypothetical protein
MWKFTSLIEEERLLTLKQPPPWNELVEQIGTRASILCGHSKEAHDYPGCFRIETCIQIDRPMFDCFFNSVSGYRAAYYRSPADGLRANEAIIRALAPRLLEVPELQQCLHVDPERSLAARSAKVWLAEPEKHLCEKCRGDWNGQGGPAEIENDRWEFSTIGNAVYGRTAPYLQKLRVFGGFLDFGGREVIPEGKVTRAEQISVCGWS